jgi:hypothetical protein
LILCYLCYRCFCYNPTGGRDSKNKLTIFYVGTSVWGGYFDVEFSEWTKPFINQLIRRKDTVVVSNITLTESSRAPENVRNLLESFPEELLEITTLSEEQEKLARYYLEEGALPQKFEPDAFHIAIATIKRVDSLVSWNYKHMVNFFRIRLYNSINLKHGYPAIDVRTPREVTYEK